MTILVPILEGLAVAAFVVLFAEVWFVVVIRRRHGGGRPLPSWMVTVERASPELRALVAKMARASAADTMQEWTTLSIGLRQVIQAEVYSMAKRAVDEYMTEWRPDRLPPKMAPALRLEIGRMVAEAFAVHDGRRN